MNAQRRLKEWTDHRDKAKRDIGQRIEDIQDAAERDDVPRIRELSHMLTDACGEYERSAKPIAEWERIVAAGPGDGATTEAGADQ